MSIRKRIVTASLIALGVGSALTVPSVVDPAPAAAANYYGAIALSPSTGQTGRSWDYQDAGSASRTAMAYCHYSDCRVVTRFVNGCGAIALSPSYWGFGTGRSLSQAQARARYSAGGGSIHDWVCTSGHL